MAIPSAIHPYFMGKNISHTPSGVTKVAGKTFSSDLRNLTTVSESLSLKLFILLLRYLLDTSKQTE